MALTVTVDEPPLHKIALEEDIAIKALGCVITKLCAAVQLFASVTVHV
jgi:hypothetical protein